MTGYPADAAATQRTGTTYKDILIPCFNAPRPALLGMFGKRPTEIAVENIAACHPEFTLKIDRRFCFDARFALLIQRNTLFKWLSQILVDRFNIAGQHVLPDSFVIGVK